MRCSRNLAVVVVCIVLAVASAGAETIFETFDGPPAEAGWKHIGNACEFVYNPAGYIESRVYRTRDVNRFVLPLSQTYDQDTEFWWEWDWRSTNIYEWPRAYFGVLHSGSDNERNLIADYFMRRDLATQLESSRAVAKSSDGTTVQWSYAGSYHRERGQAVDGRTRLHYYRNQWGEGIVSVEMVNLSTGEVIFAGSNKVLDAGKTLVFDLFGFGCLQGDSDSRQWSDFVHIDNLYFSTELDGDSYFSARDEERPVPSWVGDFTPPSPDPMAWEMEPRAISPTQIKMVARTAADESGVQYYFQNLTDPSHDSGWQDSPVYIDVGLQDNTEYTYRVKARDMSLNRNETAWSSPKSTVTPIETDHQPPVPRQPGWAVPPTVIDRNSIRMEVAPASDPEGNDPVEYYFHVVNDPALDSGWQRSTVYLVTGLDYETEYTIAVKARDSSANKNETEWSEFVTVRTEAALPIEDYLRKSNVWNDERLGAAVLLRIYSKEEDPGRFGAPVIIYVQNHGGERIGREPDVSILTDLLDEGFIVITVDYGHNPAAVSPVLEWSLYDLRELIDGGQRDALFSGTSLRTKDYEVYILPAGYRIARDLVYWEIDKHGSFGTMNRVLQVYNSQFASTPVSSPEEIVGPNGEPLDYRLKMDIIYPSRPERPVPLVFWVSTQTQRAASLRPQAGHSRALFAGFTLRGYAFANIDHAYNPLAFAYGHFEPGYSLDDWNGLKAYTAAIRFIRAHSAQFGIDPDYIGGFGHSKGAYALARLSDPNHEDQDEWFRFSGYPAGSPEPQPWHGYSSRISVSYQSMGNGTRRHERLVSPDDVPTIIAAGEFDQYGHWSYWPDLVRTYEDRDVPHIAFSLYGLGHQLPMGFDEELGVDRYVTIMDFFDRYLKVREDLPPKVLYVLPHDDRTDVDVMTTVTITFAPSMDAASVLKGVTVARAADGSTVDGTWTTAQRHTKFTWTSVAPLLPGEEYEIRIAGSVSNERGTPLGEEVVYRFKVGG